MSQFQYKALGFCCFLGVLACGIAYGGLSSEVDDGGAGPPWWLLPLAIGLLVSGILLFRKKNPDPSRMTPRQVLRHALRQTVTSQLIVFLVVGGLDFVMVYLTFFGPKSERPEFWGVFFLGLMFSICTLLVLFVLSNLWNSVGLPAQKLVGRIVDRPAEIASVSHQVAATEGVPGSEHGVISVQFVDGSSHVFQCAPDFAARIATVLAELRGRDD